MLEPLPDALSILFGVMHLARDLPFISPERIGKSGALRLRPRHEHASVHLGLKTACPCIGLCPCVESAVRGRVTDSSRIRTLKMSGMRHDLLALP
jgi:hypothetical protein